MKNFTWLKAQLKQKMQYKFHIFMRQLIYQNLIRLGQQNLNVKYELKAT